MKHKLWQNTSCDETRNLKNWDKTQSLQHINCDKTQDVTKHKFWQNTRYDETQVVTNHNLWQNISCDKTQIGTRHKLGPDASCDKTHIVTRHILWPDSCCDMTKTVVNKTPIEKKYFGTNNLTAQQPDEINLGQPIAILQCFIGGGKLQNCKN